MRRLAPVCSRAILTGCFLLQLPFYPALHAQETTGSIEGTVRDASGGVVVGATVTVKSERGAIRLLHTDSAGRYKAATLAVGIYEVTTEETGFKKTTANGIKLSVDDHLRLDIALTIGDVTQTSVVTADVPLLESDNGVLSGLVDSKKVTDLPLNGRNFAQLITLQAGVSTNLNGNQGSGQAVNGARGTGNNFLLDGGDFNDPVVPSDSAAGSTGGFTGQAQGINAVSIDAIQEFRVITSNADAEFGRNSGAQVNVITKSGTNNFHGALFEFARNRAFQARSFFDLNLAFQRDGHFIAPPFVQNNFGGVLNGPVQHDKTFFLFSYEGFRQRQGV